MTGFKRILLAEDDEDDKMIFSEILNELKTDYHFHFDAVDNGLQIVQLLRQDEALPDLVVLDQNMPQMNGKETLEVIKSDPRLKHIPVVIYSTYNDGRLSDECLRIGATQIITKPDSFEGFRTMILMLVTQYLRQ
ncbi:response regulator [Chitinophaga agrisoli]|uniref:Response regulator n=1 Tax=Chitinophaga agrisoli TaxID=2607653 RepID=A0A5B2VZ19_9BACT|nr:response regulator [Chitinophaga agrisoli]KAA2243259.1 response regulator [Chitinophaga agrisoli]